jgi:hypothetical protein
MSLPKTVMDTDTKQPGWKKKVAEEAIEYWFNFVYLAGFFTLLTFYRRLVLAEYHITYMHYGIGVFEALVLAKIILIGKAMGLGRELKELPLIYTTLYLAAVYTAFVAAFGVFEHIVVGLWHGQGFAGGLQELMRNGKDELLARCLVVFFALIPFFAFREVGRALGQSNLRTLFLRRRAS